MCRWFQAHLIDQWSNSFRAFTITIKSNQIKSNHESFFIISISPFRFKKMTKNAHRVYFRWIAFNGGSFGESKIRSTAFLIIDWVISSDWLIDHQNRWMIRQYNDLHCVKCTSRSIASPTVYPFFFFESHQNWKKKNGFNRDWYKFNSYLSNEYYWRHILLNKYTKVM